MFQSQVALLESPDAFGKYKAALTTDPTLSVDVERETEYFANQSSQFSTIMFFVGYVVGGIMALGALFGALTTMYSAIDARAMEIATLRAIGFGALAVVISVFTEALLLAVAGGVVGAAIAWAVFNGNLVNTLNQNFTQVVFPLAVTPGLLVLGIVWAVFIGLAGGLFPAVRAARLPVSEALQVR
jgi:putative ABC transport system permease protein